MAYRYSTVTDRPELVRAVALNRPVSMKQSIEIANALRKKPVAKAKRILDDAIAMRQAIPYKRFVGDTGHRKALGPGRFPVKTCREIKALLISVEAAALQKGLDSGSLMINHISAQQGSRQLHYGRHRSRMMKRTHIEIVAEATKAAEKPKKKAEPQQAVKPEEKKLDQKPEQPKQSESERKAEPEQPKQTEPVRKEEQPKESQKTEPAKKEEVTAHKPKPQVGPEAEKRDKQADAKKAESEKKHEPHKKEQKSEMAEQPKSDQGKKDTHVKSHTHKQGGKG
jgi:large subunit ribosomal protein L22